jgi:hypothetical protein
MTYVEKAGKVAPTVEGRIKILGPVTLLQGRACICKASARPSSS